MPSTAPDRARPKARPALPKNARTHGLTARDFVVAPDELEEFQELLNGYQIDVKPQGAIQQTLFDELVGAAWNLRRVRRMEAALGASDDEEVQKKLDRLARHKSRIERTFHRSLKELKALQTNAAIEATLPLYVREQVPPLSNANENAKRTHHFQHLQNRARQQAFIPANGDTSSA